MSIGTNLKVLAGLLFVSFFPAFGQTVYQATAYSQASGTNYVPTRNPDALLAGYSGGATTELDATPTTGQHVRITYYGFTMYSYITTQDMTLTINMDEANVSTGNTFSVSISSSAGDSSITGLHQGPFTFDVPSGTDLSTLQVTFAVSSGNQHQCTQQGCGDSEAQMVIYSAVVQ